MRRPCLRIAAAAAALLALAAPPAHAGSDRATRVPPNPVYQQECGACHVAYPPGLLPAESWQRVMRDLALHFGTDASLDPKLAQTLSAWLVANAGTGRRAASAPPQDRITRSAWFVREHDEVPAATWKRADVKSAANCGACHTQAERGDFDERHVRIPR